MHQETFNLSVNFCQTCCSCKSVDKNRIEGEDSATTRVILFMFNKPYSFKLIIPSAFIHQIKVKAIMPTLNNEGLLVQPNFVFLCFKIHFVCKAHKGMLAISGSCSQVRAERDWLSDWGFFFFFAVMQMLNRIFVIKRDLNVKAKLSIYRLIYVLTLTYGYKLWVVAERMRSQIQMAEISFLLRVASLSL